MRHDFNKHLSQYPIAIVGAACRLPGASNTEELWEVLATGRHTVAEPSPSRRRSFSGPMPALGGYLDHIDGFDASFFGFSPFEALRLDPHHRLLLETVWEALEDTCVLPDQLAGSRTGVYTSCLGGHYWQQLRSAGMDDMHAHLGAHRASNPAGRITHLLDLRGPSIETEATCASSLVAVHIACQAMRAGEIDMAIVGAVNLMLCAEERQGVVDAGIISPTSRCRFGDDAADGYVPAEGAVTIVLKPLDEALAAGDRIYATVLGSGVCSNGNQALSASATGTTGQEDLLRTTLREAGFAPSDVDYIEAHGTGTPKGDTVELTALSRVLGAGRDAKEPCLIGSVKSNIGHTETAAGLAGLLKTALAMKHRTIPATLHVRRPISVLETAGAPVELARESRAWPDRGRPAVAGVTALGLFGIGAHVVLGEAPRTPRSALPASSGQAMLLPLSAKDPMALSTLADAYADTLAATTYPTDVCAGAGAHRTHFPLRIAVTGANRRTLIERLRQIADQGPGSVRVLTGQPGRRTRVVYVFPGQGAQWLGMGRDLLATEPVFEQALRECDELVRAEGGWSLIDRLLDEEPMTGEQELQPAMWAIQVGLARLWRHWGIEPDLVIGHSMGEVATATTSGALTLRDGAAVICRRSVLVGTLREPGAMVAVGIGEHEANDAIGELADRVSVAVVNSSRATVLAGAPDAVAAVVDRLRERGVYCRPVLANYASHSPGVEPLRDSLVGALADLRPQPGDVPMRSTALDSEVVGEELDASYWMLNLREPVRFASAVRAVLADGAPTVFIEMSPHPLLTPAIEDEIAACEVDAAAVPSLWRDQPEGESLLAAVGRAYERGCSPNWARLYGGDRRVPLPTYPWQRKRFWVDPAAPAPVGRVTAADRSVVSAPKQQRHPTVTTSARLLAEQIADRAAEVLGASPDWIDPATPLRSAGMDSVLAVRLLVRLKQELDLHVPVEELLAARPLIELAEELHHRSTRPGPGQVKRREPIALAP